MSDSTHTQSSPHAGPHGSHEEHHHGTGVYWIVFFVLMLLLVATVGAAYIHLGIFNVPVAYLIASLKAILILWFFMHLNEQTRLTQVFAFASFAWLVIFLIMTAGDYISRQMIPRADAATSIRGVDSYDNASGVSTNRVGPGHHHTAAGEDHPEGTSHTGSGGRTGDSSHGSPAVEPSHTGDDITREAPMKSKPHE